MPTVIDAARATIRNDAVWRTCPVCDHLAPMPADAPACDRCTAVAFPTRAGEER
jgi:hypothetical protein